MMEYLKLIGIVIVIVGFALKLDSILIIFLAAVSTALVGGLAGKPGKQFCIKQKHGYFYYYLTGDRNAGAQRAS